MCVGFKKVQSDDPLPPDSLCNTFTKAEEEGECQPSPPWSSDYTPLSPHSLGGRNEHSTVEGLGCSLPPLPLCNLQSLLLSPLDLGSRSWDAPVSSWLTIFCEERGLPPQFPPAFHHQPLEKSHRRMHVVTKMKSLDWLFQRKEWSCLLRENWIRKGEEGNERRKEKLAWFLLQSFCLKVWVLWTRRWGAGRAAFTKHLCSMIFSLQRKVLKLNVVGRSNQMSRNDYPCLKDIFPPFHFFEGSRGAVSDAERQWGWKSCSQCRGA